MNQRYFPFSAVVGLEELKLSLLLALVAPEISGLLISGTKGSAKTTLVRSVKQLLGDSSKFVEMPLGVTEDRVKGSIDIGKTLSQKSVHVQDGLLAKADRGVLYVDEINLLPDHIVDLILDAAATGVNLVERDGVSVVQDARFVLIGTMNPEEGELRPQLLDRFGLSVVVSDALSKDDRIEALRRRLAFDYGRYEMLENYYTQDEAVKIQIGNARTFLTEHEPSSMVSEEAISFAVDLALSMGSEGLRGDLTLLKASLAMCALEGRERIVVDDLEKVAPLVFAHRAKTTPRQASENSSSTDPKAEGDRGKNNERSSKLQEQGTSAKSDGSPASTSDSVGDVTKDTTGVDEGSGSDRDGDKEMEGSSSRTVSGAEGRLSELASILSRPGSTHTESWRRLGREERTVSSFSPGLSIDLAASILRALEGEETTSSGVVVQEETLLFRSRQKIAESTVVFVVDISKSMGVESRVNLVKEVASSLLTSAYVKRLKVALVIFGGREATLALRPTRSLEVVRARLESLTYLGRTPLDSAIEVARQLAMQEKSKGVEPLLVFVTDGRANYTSSKESPFEGAIREARKIDKAGIAAVLCDFDLGKGSSSYAKEISIAMGATYLEMAERSA